MNREMILKVADAIEAAAKPEAKPTLGFNMGDWVSNRHYDVSGHFCGTTACIAGWTLAVSGQELSAEDSAQYLGIRNEAEAILGLSCDKAEDLFVNYPDFSDPTPSQAAAVLRHLAETGEVNWSLSKAEGLSAGVEDGR